jgi:hypothetical protein
VEGALLEAAGRAGMSIDWVRDESTGNSDHREFELLGLPAAKLGVGAGGEPCRHSACDRPERLDPVSLRLARRIVESALGVGGQLIRHAFDGVQQPFDGRLVGGRRHHRHTQPAAPVYLR